MILLGDCLERLKELEDNSVDAVVTDPPYALTPSKGAKGGFMGKAWDAEVPSVEIWRQVLRVLKPGAHLLSFGGTRTYHHMAMNVESAGFEIRDQLQWLYGSGFPKSHDISKGIDKQLGAKREVIGERDVGPDMNNGSYNNASSDRMIMPITKPATPEAYRYKGWGTALKPANEPIVLARKPLEKGLTVAQNMLKWGVGGLNIDESRIGVSDSDPNHRQATGENGDADSMFGVGNSKRPATLTQGRWPANLLLDETAAQMLDEQSGTRKSGGSIKAPETSTRFKNTHSQAGVQPEWDGYQDSGGASRFFYVAKASRRERGIGNSHPTVKPLKLMEYLCKLITPPGGVILDPFMGSGSTGVAAFKNNFKFIGIEMNAEYVAIAERRIANAKGESA